MPPAFRFGSYVLDPRTGTLSRGRERCALPSRPAQLLVFLIQHAGELVTREQIREQLWPDTVVTYDQNINFSIRRIRVALGPDAHLIQTVPRRGYRFVGDVTTARRERFHVSRTALAIAAAVSVALTVGFGAGIVMRDGPRGQFVYEHLVHPDHCPYIRMLLPTHRNS